MAMSCQVMVARNHVTPHIIHIIYSTSDLFILYAVPNVRTVFGVKRNKGSYLSACAR